MPNYTHMRWEVGPEGWELWGVNSDGRVPMQDEIALLAWVFKVHRTGEYQGVVYEEDGTFISPGPTFATLEDAQAWCITCVRMQ